jgi:hypothetical protein
MYAGASGIAIQVSVLSGSSKKMRGNFAPLNRDLRRAGRLELTILIFDFFGYGI